MTAQTKVDLLGVATRASSGPGAGLEGSSDATALAGGRAGGSGCARDAGPASGQSPPKLRPGAFAFGGGADLEM